MCSQVPKHSCTHTHRARDGQKRTHSHRVWFIPHLVPIFLHLLPLFLPFNLLSMWSTHRSSSTKIPPPLPQHLLPIPSVWPFDQNHTDKHLCSKSNIHILMIKLKLDSNCTLFPSTEQNLVLELECNVLTWFNGLHLYMSLFNVDVKLGTLLRVRDGLLELVTLNYTETMHYIVVLFVQTLKRFKCLHFKSSSNYMATYIVQKVIILQNG